MQRRVQAAAGEELAVIAHLHDAAAVQHDDAVRALDGLQPMRDDERRAPAHERGELLLNAALRFVV